MILSFFDQFSTPVLMGVPLMAVALLLPSIIFPAPNSRWLISRTVALHKQFLNVVTRQVFLPINHPAHLWALILTSLMIFLLSLNLLGLLPYTFTPTTQLSVSLGLAFPLWLSTVLLGMRNQPAISLAHLLPEGTPVPLIPILIIIETISLLIRPMALGVRLAANLTAGHLLIQLVSTGFLVLLDMYPFLAMATGGLLLMLTLLELAVAVIQAYVFVLLLSLYLQENF